MARKATSRLKVNPPLGLRPSLENCRIGDLQVDPEYQRSTDNGPSQTLIRKIAMFWDWSLFNPLAVSRRADDSLWVVDGQHRLMAMRLRGDMYDVPCVISRYDSREDEAASFVAMNVQRRAMGKLDLYRAAVAAGDQQSVEIEAALAAAGLSVALHSNHTAWKPGMIANIGGIEQVWRVHGALVARTALVALGEALAGQVLRYAGSIYPGVVAVVADETGGGARRFDPELWPMFVEMIGEGGQEAWRGDIMRARAEHPNLKFATASALVFRRAWTELTAELRDEAA